MVALVNCILINLVHKTGCIDIFNIKRKKIFVFILTKCFSLNLKLQVTSSVFCPPVLSMSTMHPHHLPLTYVLYEVGSDKPRHCLKNTPPPHSLQ